MRRLLLFVSVTALLLSAGCGAPAVKTHPVSGTVTWNGKPLPDGDILFMPTDPGKVPESGLIVDGKFEMNAKPGPNRVEIRACRPSKFDPVMGATSPEPYLPGRYNNQSILKAEVVESGDNRFTFELTEEAPRK
ncbi:hypothetical protein AYO40_01910 [Planctomycetaceae bacterium SCGC AG-212-D15]|nr:hypothetical protein AYO40_01910 [Planctomycetaceae bacterium SCGC AG-212-D15]